MPRPREETEGDWLRLDTSVSVLQRPESYADDVECVEAIEKWREWLFLTEQHVYKLKKPLQTRRIDYSTIDARREACNREAELNRRFASSVYLDVVPLALSQHGGRVAADGTPVDWLIKMRRLPSERMLDARIEEQAVCRDEIDRLGAKLSQFYRKETPVGWRGDEYRRRVETNIDAKRVSLEGRRCNLPTSMVRSVVSAQKSWLDEHQQLLEERAGRVMDAHGDLRPEHVCLEEDPVIIDCLDFAREFRLLDPVSELAFLALECRNLGASWIGERLLRAYEEHTGDDVSAALLPFYESYHALTRATIATWYLEDPGVSRPEVLCTQAETYLERAHRAMSVV